MISDEQIAAILARDEPLKATTRGLIAAANEAGGRDNITVVLMRLEVLGSADASGIEATQVGLDVGQLPAAKATVGGAAAASVERRMPRDPRAPAAKRRRRWKPGIGTVLALFVAALLLSGIYFASQAIYFVGADREGFVSVYQGVPYELPLGINLYREDYISGINLSQLPVSERTTITEHSLRSRSDADDLVRQLELGRLGSSTP
jgi:protein phosphatase